MMTVNNEIEYLLLEEKEIGSYKEITSYWYVPDHGRFAVQSVSDRSNDLEKTIVLRAVIDSTGTTHISNFHELWYEPYYTNKKNGHMDVMNAAVRHWEEGKGMTNNLWQNLT